MGYIIFDIRSFYFLWKYAYNPPGTKRGILLESSCRKVPTEQRDIENKRGNKGFPSGGSYHRSGRKEGGVFPIQFYLGYQNDLREAKREYVRRFRLESNFLERPK